MDLCYRHLLLLHVRRLDNINDTCRHQSRLWSLAWSLRLRLCVLYIWSCSYVRRSPGQNIVAPGWIPWHAPNLPVFHYRIGYLDVLLPVLQD